MAVRLVEAAEQGMAALLARRMDEGGVAAEANQLLVHALAEADRGLGEADHQHRPGQVRRASPASSRAAARIADGRAGRCRPSSFETIRKERRALRRTAKAHSSSSGRRLRATSRCSVPPGRGMATGPVAGGVRAALLISRAL